MVARQVYVQYQRQGYIETSDIGFQIQLTDAVVLLSKKRGLEFGPWKVKDNCIMTYCQLYQDI